MIAAANITKFLPSHHYCGRDRRHSGGFYLGLRRLRGVPSPPAPHDCAAGGPFFAAATAAAGGTAILCGNGLTQAELFYFAAKKIRIGRRSLLRQGQVLLRRLLLRIMPPSCHPVPACTPRLRCRRAILRCRNSRCRRNRSTLRQRPYAGGTVLLCGDKNWNRTQNVIAAWSGSTPAALS